MYTPKYIDSKIIPVINPNKKFNSLISCNLCNPDTIDEVIIETDPIILFSITTTSKANHKILPKNFNGETINVS